MKLILVSGRSGSGKSVALRVLEDLGFYAVDNLPLNLLPALIHMLTQDQERVAISVDVRNMPYDANELGEILDYLPDSVELDLIYLDADDNALIRRFAETRRLHPLSADATPLDEAIKQERLILDPLASRADMFVDTTDLSVHALAELIREKVLGKKDKRLIITFESFGFKHGIPKDADFMFDARFLPNPHWEPELKPLTGLDQPVKDYLASHQVVNKFIWQISGFLQTWLPHLERNNRSYLTIAIGCTGGQHRSVFVAESLAQSFGKTLPDVKSRHRDIKYATAHV